MKKTTRKNKHKMIKPGWRLTGGIVLLVSSSLLLLFVLLTGIPLIANAVSIGVQLILGISILISHEHYKKQYQMRQGFAQPVSDDGSKLEDNSDDFQQAMNLDLKYPDKVVKFNKHAYLSFLVVVMALVVYSLFISPDINTQFSLIILSTMIYPMIAISTVYLIVPKEPENVRIEHKILATTDILLLCILVIVITIMKSYEQWEIIVGSIIPVSFCALFSILIWIKRDRLTTNNDEAQNPYYENYVNIDGKNEAIDEEDSPEE